jgi:hypothetical protein
MSHIMINARRSFRFSFLTLALLAMALVALLMLERTSSSAPVVTKLVPASSSASHSDGKGGEDKGDKDHKPKHCKDGHGKDDEHNKHCKISEG